AGGFVHRRSWQWFTSALHCLAPYLNLHLKYKCKFPCSPPSPWLCYRDRAEKKVTPAATWDGTPVNLSVFFHRRQGGASMTIAFPGSPPEQGQLVNVRQRQYVVTEVAKSTLPTSPLRSSDNGAQHLVSLSSVEDDALGEELQVIWELEPGAQVI